MTREATLLAKREELEKCIQRRSSLLLDIYRSAAVLSNIKKQSLDASSLLDIDLAGERLFLETNDLSIGRSFNPSTLPHLSPKLSQSHLSPTGQLQDDTTLAIDRSLAPKPTIGEDAPQPAHTLDDSTGSVPSTTLDHPDVIALSKRNQDLSGLDESGAPHSHTNDVEKHATAISKVVNELDVGVTADSIESQVIRPVETASLLADDANNLSEPGSAHLEAENRRDGVHSVHLAPKEQQEERWENLDSAKSDLGRQPSFSHGADGDRSPAQLPSRHSPHETSQPDKEPNHQISTELDLSQGTGQIEGDGLLNAQTPKARSDAVIDGSPYVATDEQLQLKEVQPSGGQNSEPHLEILPLETSNNTGPNDTYSRLNEVDKEPQPTSPISNSEVQPIQGFERDQQHVGVASQFSGLRNHVHPGMASDIAKDITFSQRPPMRIDTGISSESSKVLSFKKPLESGVASSHTPPDSATSARASQGSAQAHSPPERMTTRVSSGALRHKSVSEILGEIPKPVTPHLDKSVTERINIDSGRDAGLQSPKSSISVASPDPATFRLRLSELKEKEKSKLSTVVFARKQQLQPDRNMEKQRSWETEVAEVKARNYEYFLPLFHAQATSPPRAPAINRLIGSASKTLTTENHYVDYHEQQDCRILSRIDQLQRTNRWSLRQLERSVEPTRPTLHWDVVLSQMKWLRTDFREERKWKMVAASSVANWCAQWVTSSREERLVLQIKARSPPSIQAPETAPTPDLVPSGEDDLSDAAEDETDNITDLSRKAPAAIFSMAPDMFYFGLERTPSADKLLQELPLYQPSVEIQQAALLQSRGTPDKEWKTAILPVSRFAEGKLISHNEGPPRKKSRYEYANADDDREYLSTGVADSDDKTPDPPPKQDDVALFNPENKHIRDRIHAGHAFRPPSEHVMPSQSFFESRNSSQWTHAEDDELRRLVREYAYNWSLISSCLSFPSAYSSGAERRTPWECFERWIGLEGLPAEMAKTQYFRAYHQRLQAAQTTHEAQQQGLQQQQAGNIPPRRRSTQPFWVERRRNMKHVHLVNAMKNLARKREATIKKPEKVMEAAATRKAAAAHPRPTMQTPQEFSRLRHERDMKMQEQARMYRMQMIQQQKVHAAQRAGVQPNQHPSGASLAQPNRNAIQALPNGNGPASLLPNGQIQQNIASQPRLPQMSRPSNGVQTNGMFPTNQQGIPHAPMQPAPMLGPARLPPQMASDNQRVFQEVSRVQAEQQRFLQQQQQRQQQQQHHTQMNGQTSPNLSNSNFLPPNGSSSHATFQRQSGSPSANGAPTPNGSSSSPRLTNPSQPQALSSGMMPTINQIMSQLRVRNPNATHEQISQMATDRLKQYHSHAHAAMQAAAGNSVNAAMNGHPIGNLTGSSQQQPAAAAAMMNANPLTTTQQYTQMIRNQQQHQQNRSSSTPHSGQQPSSRGATPQIHRTPSAQGSHPSPNLVPSQAQVAGGH